MELDGRLLAWVALSALLIATPGPDTALIIRNALAAGPRASTMSALGVAAGSLFSTQREEVGSPTHHSRLSRRTAWSQGLFSNLLNPKTGAFFVTVMPQFIVPGDPATRLLLMVAAFEVMLLVWLIAYGHVVSRLGRSGLGTRVRQLMTRLTGLVLIGLGARLAFERR